MNAIFALPISLRMVAVGLLGTLLGALVNWATYRLAWTPRGISPWGPQPKKAPPRRLSDRIPVLGWLGLRREAKLHGTGFWIRPMFVELAMGVGLAALYWWEVDRQALIYRQLNAAAGLPLPLVSDSLTHSMFLCHAFLIVLMAAASFIDIDEKIIPDTITDIGTLLGLVLMTLLPAAFLPHVSARMAPPPVGEPLALKPIELGTLYSEPLTISAPVVWPELFNSWQGVCLGIACWWFFCFAIIPRRWRGRHGVCRAFALIFQRIVRELRRLPLSIVALVGTLAIPAVWYWGGSHWIGLLTSLLGMVVCGGIVWIVRIVGTAALQREAMGFGDVTLMMMIGTIVGWQPAVMIFFVAPFTGILVGVLQLVLKRDDEIPYGPFLCLGTLIVIIWWPQFWSYPVQDMFGVGWLIPTVLLVGFSMLGLMLFLWQQIKNALFRRDENDEEDKENDK